MCYAPNEAVVALRKKLMFIWYNAAIDDNSRKKISAQSEKTEIRRIQDVQNARKEDRFSDLSDLSEGVALITAM